MALMAFLPRHAPAKGRWCVDTDGFCPFWWSSEFAWATQPSVGLLTQAPPGVPGRPRCQAALWKTSKAVMQVWNPRGSQEGEQGTEQPWADVQHFVLTISSGHRTALARWAKALPAGEPQDCPRAQKAPPEAAAKGEVTALQEMQLKLTTCGCTFVTVWAENASFPLPSASLRCWHSAAETWSNQCSYGEVCLAWEMILLNRSIKFVSVFADNFHEYITLKYGTSVLTYSLWCSKWLGKNPL